MKIEAGKFYKTRDGRKAYILKTDGRGSFPVIGYITDTLCDSAKNWTRSGKQCIPSHETVDDIVGKWTQYPKIMWDRIPDFVSTIIVDADIGISCESRDGRLHYLNKQWSEYFFPNCKDFAGATFNRPEE